MGLITRQLGRLFTQIVLAAELTQRTPVHRPWDERPNCGPPLGSKGYLSRQMETLIGAILERAKWGVLLRGVRAV